jgi:adenylate cyclase
MNRTKFFESLLTRNSKNADSFDRELEAQLSSKGTVLVSDASGFTRITRSRGIIHFLSMLAQSYKISIPIVKAHHGVLIKSEADNLIAHFTDPWSALQCALEMQRSHAIRNSALPEDEHFHLSIGVDHGPFLLLEDDAYGDAVNLAYKVGEDIARPQEILITERLLQELKLDPSRIEGWNITSQGERETGGLKVHLHAVSW